MKTHAFSGETLKLLRKAGWYEGRSVDTSAWERLLRKEGFTVHPVVTAFLQEFGGLEFKNPKKAPQASADWHFCVERAVERIYPERVVKYYNRRAGHQLCLIGDASNGYLILMMDETGQVYGGYDEEFFYLGKSGPEAIETLRTGRDLGRVPELPES